MDNLARLMLVKAIQAISALPKEQVPPYVAVQMGKVAAEISHASWTGATDLDQTAQETMPAEGYDVLDSLRSDPGLAPLLARIQELGLGQK